MIKKNGGEALMSEYLQESMSSFHGGGVEVLHTTHTHEDAKSVKVSEKCGRR